MREFINEFGKENFTIIAIVVLVILVALMLIVVLEKTQIKKTIKKRTKLVLKNSIQKKQEKNEDVQNKKLEKKKRIDYKTLEALKSIEKMEDTIGYINQKKQIQEKAKEAANHYINSINQKPVIKTSNDNSINSSINPQKEENNVVYKKNTRTPEEAKEKLEEVTRKLVEENSEVEHTFFEDEQEEKSIISYEELIKASKNIDEKNDRLLEDEQSAAITLDELYKETRRETVPKTEEKSFNKQNNNDIISPVYGRNKNLEKRTKEQELYNDIQNESSEVFLEKLKNLRSKLD